ncbi:hypothetical protein [Thermogemmatispora sp.]|jgi:hypothetical protein
MPLREHDAQFLAQGTKEAAPGRLAPAQFLAQHRELALVLAARPAAGEQQ